MRKQKKEADQKHNYKQYKSRQLQKNYKEAEQCLNISNLRKCTSIMIV